MGMDLISIDPNAPEEGQSLHLNWTGWGIFGDLLEELGCDLSLMAGSNDGEIIDPDTCCAWASAITNNLNTGRIYTLDYVDLSFHEGYRTEYHVEGTDTPVLLSSYSQVAAIVSASFKSLSEKDNSSSSKEMDTMPIKKMVTPVSEDGQWLAGIAKFLDTCGGCAQH